MKAAVVHDFTQPLVIEERPVPEPGPHQVRVRIEASGLCHTDIHAAHGDWPVRPTPPFVPGHEGVGIVEAAGAEVRHVRVGERVAIPWLAEACGRCDHCVSGWETLCTRQQNSGYSVDGAYAEQALAHGDYVVPVPDGLDPLDAAPLSCAGVTTYKALKVSGAGPGTRVLVSGIGGLGHLALPSATSPSSTPAWPAPRPSPSTSPTTSSPSPANSARTTSSTPASRTSPPRSRSSAEPTPRSPSPSATPPSRPPTPRCAAAAPSSWSPCPPRAGSNSRSSTPS